MTALHLLLNDWRSLAHLGTRPRDVVRNLHVPNQQPPLVRRRHANTRHPYNGLCHTLTHGSTRTWRWQGHHFYGVEHARLTSAGSRSMAITNTCHGGKGRTATDKVSQPMSHVRDLTLSVIKATLSPKNKLKRPWFPQCTLGAHMLMPSSGKRSKTNYNRFFLTSFNETKHAMSVYHKYSHIR